MNVSILYKDAYVYIYIYIIYMCKLIEYMMLIVKKQLRSLKAIPIYQI